MTNEETNTTESNLNRELNYYVNAANESREEFIKNLSHDVLSAGLYAFNWSDATVEALAVGSLAQTVLNDVEEHGVTVQAALAETMSRVQNALMHNEFSAGSSGHGRNAAESQTRAGYAKFYRIFKARY